MSSTPRDPHRTKSCADCRRLKLRCDRSWPCSSCVKRGKGHFCPEGLPSGQSAEESLAAKVSILEARLREAGEDPNSLEGYAHEAPSPPSPSPLGPQRSHRANEWTRRSSRPPTDAGGSPGGAGLLVSYDEGESSHYVGGGATGAHRIDMEGGLEDTSEDAGFVTAARASLPPLATAQRLCDIYFKHGCVEFAVLDAAAFHHGIMSPIYAQTAVCHKHAWAILFLVLALGSHFDPLAPWDDAQPHTLFDVARSLFDVRELEEQHTLTSVRALHLIGIFCINARVRGSEKHWPWLGMQMRIVQAMGLHRDGVRFGLNDQGAEQRRRTFWECQTFDRLHSLSLGRPYAIADHHIDTQFPQSTLDEHELSFERAKFRLGQVRGRIADELFSLRACPYATVLDLDGQLRDLERTLHATLRWTGSATQGAHVDIDERTTLPDLPTMRRYYLSIMIQETVMCLHRSHFSRALTEQDGDPLHSPFSSSVVALLDAARRLIAITTAANNAFPAVAGRWAFLFTRTFSAGVCIGVCATRFPLSVVTTSSLGDLYTLQETFASANRGLSVSKRPLDRWVTVLEELCSAARRSSDAPPGRPAALPKLAHSSSLDLVSGATRLTKRRHLDPAPAASAGGQVPFGYGNQMLANQPTLMDSGFIPGLEDFFDLFDQAWIDPAVENNRR